MVNDCLGFINISELIFEYSLLFTKFCDIICIYFFNLMVVWKIYTMILVQWVIHI